MPVPGRVAAVVPPSHRRMPGWLRLAVVPGVALLVAVGVWVTGAALTQDAAVAKALTGGWLAVAGLAAVVAALRWRGLALPVLAAYVVTAGGLGGFLLVTSSVDRVVSERVTVAAAEPTPSARGGADAADRPAPPSGPRSKPQAPAAPRAVAAGRFTSAAHETGGTATLIDRPDGRRVLTLTGFATDPGPDLRVYLVPGDGHSVSGARDLGRLRGNRGDQEYAVPAAAPTGAVVIWCRAFSVAFGSARLG
jgi:hypothetical protein